MIHINKGRWRYVVVIDGGDIGSDWSMLVVIIMIVDGDDCKYIVESAISDDNWLQWLIAMVYTPPVSN